MGTFLLKYYCKKIVIIVKKEELKMFIPQNPVILLSYINTELRDNYADLDDLCKSLDIEKKEITYILKKIGYKYNENSNQFKLTD